MTAPISTALQSRSQTASPTPRATPQAARRAGGTFIPHDSYLAFVLGAVGANPLGVG